MLLGILLSFHILVCVALIGVVLLQQSEGGALGMGGGPTGFMSARGAGDVLTRATWILFSLFLALSLGLTLLGGRVRASSSVTDRMKIDRIDPSKLGKPLPLPSEAPPPVTPTPLGAPAPGLRLPPAEGSAPPLPAPKQ